MPPDRNASKGIKLKYLLNNKVKRINWQETSYLRKSCQMPQGYLPKRFVNKKNSMMSLRINMVV